MHHASQHSHGTQTEGICDFSTLTCLRHPQVSTRSWYLIMASILASFYVVDIQTSLKLLRDSPTSTPSSTPRCVSLRFHAHCSYINICYHHTHISPFSSDHRSKGNDEHQDRGGVLFAGAWLGYGFHEDGFTSDLRAVVEHIDGV